MTVPVGVDPKWMNDPEHAVYVKMAQERDATTRWIKKTFGGDEEEWEEPSETRQFAELPPMVFEEFIGQKRHIKRLKAAIIASDKRNRPLPHMAFIGPAGTGKTSLAACCANFLDRTALMTTGSALINMSVVADIVSQVDGGIMFIDEAHDLKLGEGVVSGMLPLLEDWKLSMSTGTKNVEPFTCIMATTEWGTLDGALRSRMGEEYELDRYDEMEMTLIGLEHAKRLEIPLDRDRANLIAKRSRKNPRKCRQLLIEAYHMAIAGGEREVTSKACYEAFDCLKLDRWGLKEVDRDLLRLIREKPVAKSRCAGYLGMDTRTFEALVVPYLFSEGYMLIGSRGAELTDKGKLFIGELDNDKSN